MNIYLIMYCKKVVVVSLIIGLQASNLFVTGAPQAVEKVDPLETVQRSALRAHNLQFPYKGGVVLDAKTWPCSGLQSLELSVATPLETSQGLFSEEAQSNFIYPDRAELPRDAGSRRTLQHSSKQATSEER